MEWETYEGDDPIREILILNIDRRHLNDSQRAMAASRLAALKPGTNRKNTRQLAGVPTQAEAAALLNVSERSIQRAREVIDTATPEVVAAVDRGDMTVAAAVEPRQAPRRASARARRRSGRGRDSPRDEARGRARRRRRSAAHHAARDHEGVQRARRDREARSARLANRVSRQDVGAARARGPSRVTKRRSLALRVVEAIELDENFEFLPGVPTSRADCVDGPRPCPYISCRHHLWLIEQRDRPGNPARGAQGAATLRPIGASCSLDVAIKPHSLDEVASILGVVPTRIHQITLLALEEAARARTRRRRDDRIAVRSS